MDKLQISSETAFLLGMLLGSTYSKSFNHEEFCRFFCGLSEDGKKAINRDILALLQCCDMS